MNCSHPIAQLRRDAVHVSGGTPRDLAAEGPPTSALTDAAAHLGKAREFLEAAELNNDRDRYNAATSNAVTSGINSKDAICLTLTGRTGKSENHAEALVELRA
ncbi:MAG: hypothetical protein ABIP19_03125, partial [Dermatophilaceae bacterium]